MSPRPSVVDPIVSYFGGGRPVLLLYYNNMFSDSSTSVRCPQSTSCPGHQHLIRRGWSDLYVFLSSPTLRVGERGGWEDKGHSRRITGLSGPSVFCSSGPLNVISRVVNVRVSAHLHLTSTPSLLLSLCDCRRYSEIK